MLLSAAGVNGKISDSFTSVNEAPLHMKGHGKGHELAGPPEAVLREIDAQELNRMFVRRCSNCTPVWASYSIEASLMFVSFRPLLCGSTPRLVPNR